MLDASGNVGRENFQSVIQFARRLVEKLDIGPDNVKLAIIYYGDKAQTLFDLNRFSNSAGVLEALPEIPYLGGVANVSGAIFRMRTESFTPASGDRRGVPNVGVLVSGGRSPNRQNTIDEATLARNSGTLMYYVGKLPEIDIEESLGIIGKENYGYLVSRWEYMTSEFAANSITRRLCSKCTITSSCWDIPPHLH